ncbi:MAG: two-component system cell cycle response regulator, partial [Sulfurimonas sp.]|uniref:GGDEF domain-containing protein n=1 Tax=Sulfurimonas sp. TaxID=2022749 RepID=UPI0039E6D575
MQSKTKILFIVTAMLFTLGLATIINVALNFRDYSIKNAIEKSQMTANIIEDGLTAHMVNGTMDKRLYFLDQISRNDEIKSLWLVRSQSVIDQYGAGFNNETVRDAIDEKVLNTGKMIQEIVEHTNDILLRVTIPYKANQNREGANCLNCHNVQSNHVLGAISMEFDISDMRTDGMITLIKILGINLIFTIIVLILINKYVSPYTKLFSNMQKGVTKAYRGDFTHKFNSYTVTGEAKELVAQMNSLFGKMQEAFGDIKFTLATFIPNNNIVNNDPLHEAKSIINELSDIYKFKKTIELDISKDKVYSRLIEVLQNKYKLEHFALYEVNNIKETRHLVYITSGKSICLDIADKDSINCRAHRTKTDVISTEFPNLCESCCSEEVKYMCIPFSINKDIGLVISLSAKSEEALNEINMKASSIKNYFEAAKPVVESRILMDKLRDTSLRDGMTGLYNRRFLEEFIDKVMSQVQRENETYSVMMLDVDFFKMVNDTYGHDIGDKVIVEIGKLLKDNIREADLAIRYGGEEFVVMLHNAHETG